MKIGISDDPEKRRRQLQTGNPTKLSVYHRELVGTEAASVIERFIHGDLRPYRLKGEWFALNAEQAAAEVAFGRIRWEDSPEVKREIQKKQKNRTKPNLSGTKLDQFR